MTLIPFPEPLIEAVFLKRYKRFFTDVRLLDGSVVTAHCPNTGSMRGALKEGTPCLIWDSADPTRKLRYSLKATKPGRAWVGVDTLLPNRLAAAAIQNGEIAPLAGFGTLAAERKMGENSRVDLLLEKADQRCWVEVKNVSLVEGGRALFPDAVTTRGLKHLFELTERVREGDRAAMVYVVQRADGQRFAPADAIDPAYGQALREARARGVEVYALGCKVSKKGVQTRGLLALDF